MEAAVALCGQVCGLEAGYWMLLAAGPSRAAAGRPRRGGETGGSEPVSALKLGESALLGRMVGGHPDDKRSDHGRRHHVSADYECGVRSEVVGEAAQEVGGGDDERAGK